MPTPPKRQAAVLPPLPPTPDPSASAVHIRTMSDTPSSPPSLPQYAAPQTPVMAYIHDDDAVLEADAAEQPPAFAVYDDLEGAGASQDEQGELDYDDDEWNQEEEDEEWAQMGAVEDEDWGGNEKGAYGPSCPPLLHLLGWLSDPSTSTPSVQTLPSSTIASSSTKRPFPPPARATLPLPRPRSRLRQAASARLPCPPSTDQDRLRSLRPPRRHLRRRKKQGFLV